MVKIKKLIIKIDKKQNKIKMSIYSGFATRHQEESYDQLVEDLIFVFQKRLLKFYKQQTADEYKFFEVLKHIQGQLVKMEEHKYLQPKTSKSFDQVLRYLQKQHNKNHEDQHHFQGHKDSQTTPLRLENKLKTHRDSFIQEPGSIGKIIHQIPRREEENSSLADSRNTFWNPDGKFKSEQPLKQPKQKIHLQENPENLFSEEKSRTFLKNNDKFQTQNSLKGIKFHSNNKLARKEKQKDKSEDYLIEYLEKNNKNYLRGYRKRQVKTRQFSSKDHTTRI